MSSDRTRAAIHALRSVSVAPNTIEAANVARTAQNGAASASSTKPAANVAPAIQRNSRRRRAASSPTAIGSSCSSHARMPASATASAMVDADSFAASYFTCSRRPIRSAENASSPRRVLNRRSSSATSSRQSIPSTLKVDSA